jgi:hypothetical protein
MGQFATVVLADFHLDQGIELSIHGGYQLCVLALGDRQILHFSRVILEIEQFHIVVPVQVLDGLWAIVL